MCSLFTLAPYSSNMFQQQPQHFHPEYATQPAPTTIPPSKVFHFLNFYDQEILDF